MATLSEEELEKLLTDDEIAPQPSKEDIFGAEIERLANELTEDQKRLQQLEAEASNKVKSNLESKLAARRQRRARKNLEMKEMEYFGKED